MFIMSSNEFINEAGQNKNGVNVGKRSIKFNGVRQNKGTKQREEYVKERYRKYLVKDFRRLLGDGI